jgi:hypothetical protein
MCFFQRAPAACHSRKLQLVQCSFCFVAHNHLLLLVYVISCKIAFSISVVPLV